MRIALGVLIAVAIGAACRWFHIPVPAPPTLVGALLVVAVTAGYLGADWLIGKYGADRSLPAQTRRHAEDPDRAAGGSKGGQSDSPSTP